MQPKNLKPTEILVLEEYTYQSKVSGVRSLKLASMPTGLIFVRAAYDSYKLSTSASMSHQRRPVNPGGMGGRFAEPIGYLQCSHYGMSNLDREPDLAWEGDLLPLKITFSPRQLSQLNKNQRVAILVNGSILFNMFLKPLLNDRLSIIWTNMLNIYRHRRVRAPTRSYW